MDDAPEQHTSQDIFPRGSRFLHGTVTEWLRLRLQEGSLKAGAKLPPLREIADQFAVSTATVRRAIKTLEQEGYLTHIPAVGVFVRPDDSAPPHPQEMVTFIANDLISPFEAALARGIKNACHAHGWQVQIFEGQDDEQREKTGLLRLRGSGSQGAIVLPSCTAESVNVLRELSRDRFPLILVDRAIPGLNADLVESDHEGAAYRATEYLIRNGHTCVLIITPVPGVLSEEARIRGYEQALRDAGMEPAPEAKILIDPQTETLGGRQHQRWLGAYEAAKPRLGQFKPPFAVFAHNDNSGWGVYEACRELGLRIPQDVSIVSVDDSEIAQAMTPPMTVVAQRTDELARQAVELLKQQIDSAGTDSGPRQTFHHAIVGVDLVERQSVASLR